jgi:2-oxoisovalerate dehydrogenase E1 component beta subunit
MGEDVGIYGGAFKVTEGFVAPLWPRARRRHPHQPKSAIVGSGLLRLLTHWNAPGRRISIHGFHHLRAFNQIVQHSREDALALGRSRPARSARPQRRRRPAAAPYHSQNNEMCFVHTPGLKVVAPGHRGYDAKGLIKAAIRDNNPLSSTLNTNISIAASKAMSPKEDYIVPIGKGQYRPRRPRRLSIITYGAMLHTVAQDAAEILKPRKASSSRSSISAPCSPLDREAIKRKPSRRQTKS